MLLGSPRPINYLPGAVLGRTFNGTSDFYSHAIDLSAETKLTLAFWMYWNAYANDNHICAEYGAGGDPTGSGAFTMIPDDSGSSQFTMWMYGPAGKWSDWFPRPSAAGYHHYVLEMDRAGPTNKAWVDGSQQAMTAQLHQSATGNFGNLTLWLMSRGGASLFGAGRLGLFGMWGSAVSLTATEKARLINGEAPNDVHPTNLLLHVETF